MDCDKLFEGELLQARLSSLPLCSFVSELCSRQHTDYDPDRRQYLKFKTPLWDFCRQLKAHPELRGVSTSRAFKATESCFAQIGWHWTDFTDIDSDEDGRAEFLAVWEAVRSIPGYTVLDSALEKSKEAPLLLPDVAYPTEGYKLFLSFAYWLQRIMRDRDIFLPCRRLATLLNCRPNTICRYRQFAVKEGYLRITKAHHYNPHTGAGEATEFRFAVERFA